MKKVLCFLVLAGSTLAQAAQPAITRAEAIAQIKNAESVETTCLKQGDSTAVMNECAGEAADKVDALLNKVYAEKMQSLNAEQKTELRKEERKFVAMKTRAEQLIVKQDDGGTITDVEVLSKDEELDKAQVLKLLK